VVALDIPSGLEATTGEIYKPCIQASTTMTLALPKKGLLKQKARSVVGSLYLADIGVPNVLYKELGIEVEPMFIQDTIIKLHDLQGEMLT
jgi:NAD(P)H-hydrate epimerase